MTRCSFLALLACVAAAPVAAEDWPRFRGPNGSGVSTDATPVPVEWGPDKNMKWKVALPGPGSSCPIVIGDSVFVTCWSGYGTDQRNPGEQRDLRRHLLRIDRNTGKTLWSKSVEAVLPEDRYAGMFAEHGYASHTPVSDGENVYVFFGKTGVLAFDMDGNKLWQTSVGTGSGSRGWGSSSSPILYEKLVIVPAVAEGQALVALDKKTGEEVWKAEARGFAGTWGTPVLVETPEGRTDVVIGVPYEFWAFNPDDGKLRWFCEVMETDTYCSSVIAADGIIYGIEGQRGGGIAVKAGGEDDVTKTHVVWTGRDRNRIGTPVAKDGLLYFISGGMVNCIDAKTGEEVYRERLAAGSRGTEAPRPGAGGATRGGRGGGQDYSSPIIADGKLYYVTRGGVAHVVKTGREFDQLAANRMTEDREDFSASPAVSAGELFIRSDKHLYCVSEKR